MPRVIRAFKLSVIAGTAVTTFGFLLAEIFPQMISSAFTTSDELIGMASRGMRLNLLMFPVVGFQVVTSSFFQSIGRAKISIILSHTRQVLLLIPALLILPHFFGLNGVWLSAPVADFTATLITLLVLRWQMEKLKKMENVVF